MVQLHGLCISVQAQASLFGTMLCLDVVMLLQHAVEQARLGAGQPPQTTCWPGLGSDDAVAISSLSGVTQISLGSRHALALLK